MSSQKRQLVWILITFCVVVALDQTTKVMVDSLIPEGDALLGGHERDFFWLTHQRNPGLVGGMFRESPYVAMLAPIIATFVLIYLYRHLDASSRFQSLAYGLVAGGAIGNLIDRVFRHEVVDFLQFHFWFIPFDFPWKLYPAFNVADTAICTGVVLLILGWRSAQPAEEQNVSNAA